MQWSDYCEKRASRPSSSSKSASYKEAKKVSSSDDDFEASLNEYMANMSKEQMQWHYQVCDMMGIPHEAVALSVMNSPRFQEYAVMRALKNGRR